MAVVIGEMNMDVEAAPEPKRRGEGGGGDSASNSGGEPPKPEEIERMWQQRAERMERVRAH